MAFQFGGTRRINDKIDQFPTMRGNKMAARSQLCEPPGFLVFTTDEFCAGSY